MVRNSKYLHNAVDYTIQHIKRETLQSRFAYIRRAVQRITHRCGTHSHQSRLELDNVIRA